MPVPAASDIAKPERMIYFIKEKTKDEMNKATSFGRSITREIISGMTMFAYCGPPTRENSYWPVRLFDVREKPDL